MEEDRPGLGIGLRLRERPVGENEIGRARLDIGLAMPAGDAVAVRDVALRRLAVRVSSTGPERQRLPGRHGDELDRRHGPESFHKL